MTENFFFSCFSVCLGEEKQCKLQPVTVFYEQTLIRRFGTYLDWSAVSGIVPLQKRGTKSIKMGCSISPIHNSNCQSKLLGQVLQIRVCVCSVPFDSGFSLNPRFFFNFFFCQNFQLPLGFPFALDILFISVNLRWYICLIRSMLFSCFYQCDIMQ